VPLKGVERLGMSQSKSLPFNWKAVLTISERFARGRISIGETVLLFIDLFEQNFDWLVGNAANAA